MHGFVRRPVFIRPCRTCIFMFFSAPHMCGLQNCSRHRGIDLELSQMTSELSVAQVCWSKPVLNLSKWDLFCRFFGTCLNAISNMLDPDGRYLLSTVVVTQSHSNRRRLWTTFHVSRLFWSTVVRMPKIDPFIRTIWTWMEVFCQKKDEERMVLFWLHGFSSTLKVPWITTY